MIITVYNMDGWICDTPLAHRNDHNELIYEDISGMSVRSDHLPSVTFRMPIGKSGQILMCEEDQLECLKCAKKIETFLKSKTLDNWQAMKKAVDGCRQENITLEDFAMPKPPFDLPRDTSRIDPTIVTRNFRHAGKVPFDPPKLSKVTDDDGKDSE